MRTPCISFSKVNVDRGFCEETGKIFIRVHLFNIIYSGSTRAYRYEKLW